MKRFRHAIWTVSGIGDTPGDFVGGRVCVFSRGGISDSHLVDFCGDFADRAFVYGWDADGLRIRAQRSDSGINSTLFGAREAADGLIVIGGRFF